MHNPKPLQIHPSKWYILHKRPYPKQTITTKPVTKRIEIHFARSLHTITCGKIHTFLSNCIPTKKDCTIRYWK